MYAHKRMIAVALQLLLGCCYCCRVTHYGSDRPKLRPKAACTKNSAMMLDPR